jgi:hypothetical protein
MYLGRIACCMSRNWLDGASTVMYWGCVLEEVSLALALRTGEVSASAQYMYEKFNKLLPSMHPYSPSSLWYDGTCAPWRMLVNKRTHFHTVPVGPYSVHCTFYKIWERSNTVKCGSFLVCVGLFWHPCLFCRTPSHHTGTQWVDHVWWGRHLSHLRQLTNWHPWLLNLHFGEPGDLSLPVFLLGFVFSHWSAIVTHCLLISRKCNFE